MTFYQFLHRIQNIYLDYYHLEDYCLEDHSEDPYRLKEDVSMISWRQWKGHSLGMGALLFCRKLWATREREATSTSKIMSNSKHNLLRFEH
jgi:hypothetical protein